MIYLRRAFGLTLAIFALMITFNPNAATLLHAQSGTEESTTSTPAPTSTPVAEATSEATSAPDANTTDSNAVTIDGSNIVSPVVKAAVDAYKIKDPTANIQIAISGTGGGFEKLCNGTLDVNMAVRGIEDAEAALCDQKGVKFIELVLGYDALVIVVNSASTATCLGPELVPQLLSPGASGVKNWSAVDPALTAPIDNVYLPKEDTKTYILADALIVGDKLRTDAQIADTPEQIADKVSSDVNGVGIMSLSDYTEATGQGRSIKAVQIKYPGACIDPTVPNIEQARYSLAQTLFLYVNAASLDRKPVADFLNYLLSSDGRSAVTQSDFLLGDNVTYDRGQNYIANRQTGRTFSRIQVVNVPIDVAGAVTSENAAAAFELIRDITNTFNTRYANVSMANSAYGNEVAYRKLCTNSIDVVGATRKLTDAEAETCQKTNVQTMQLNLGSQALVLLVNGNNTFASCLKTDQLVKIFGIESEGKVKKWSDVSPDFPATDLMVLAPNAGAPETDLLMGKLVKSVAPLMRKDVEANDDALYRAAAVQNVEGGITFVPYDQYKKNTSKVNVVKVDAGSGCVEPTEDNIKNGTYTLAQPFYAILNQGTFNRPEMKAFVWFLLSDDALAIIAKRGLVGTDTAGFTAAREIALERFSATGGTATPVAQPTAAATSAATEVPTAAATAEATATTEAATTVATESSTQAATTAP